jgi:hypothetical protein
MSYIVTLSIATQYRIKRKDEKYVMGIGKNQSVPKSRHNPDICLQDTREITRNLRQDDRPSDTETKRTSPEYMCTAFPLHLCTKH